MLDQLRNLYTFNIADTNVRKSDVSGNTASSCQIHTVEQYSPSSHLVLTKKTNVSLYSSGFNTEH